MLTPELKKVVGEILKHRSSLWVVAVSGVLMAVVETVNINLLKKIFDGVENGQVHVIKDTFLLIIVLALIKAISRYVHLFQMNMVAEKVTVSLRSQLQSKFMRLSLSFHNQFAAGSGGLMSRILNDIVVIFHGQRMFADFIREPILFLGLMGTLFYLNWKLTLTILVVLPLVLFFLRQISKSIKKYSLSGQEELANLTGTIKESLDGVRTIQSFNLQKNMEDRFELEASRFLRSRRKIHSLVESSGPVTEFVMTLVIFSILLYMTLGISKGSLSLGDLVAYATALLSLGSPVKKMQESYVRIQECSAAAERVYQLLDDHREVIDAKKDQPFPSNWKAIRFENVSFSYGDETVLHQINFEVRRGEKVAFVGASGSGKSTLVNLLERFFEPTEGEIKIDSTNLRDISLVSLRENIGLVSQDVFLFQDTIEKNIIAGRAESKAEPQILHNACSSAYLDGVLTKMPEGLQSQVGERGNLLSGGEKQRVAIARALYKNAPILILDEATSALDSDSEKEVQKGLDELTRGRTSFVVAHRLSTIRDADQIFVLSKGSIVEKGTHEQLLGNG